MLEKISRDLDDADDRTARAKAAVAAAATAATAAQSHNKNASVGGWWDDLPEAPTGDPSSALVTTTTTSTPQYSIAKPPASAGMMVPSAPPADAVYDWDAGGGAGVGYGYGSVGPGAVTRGVGAGLALQDAFSSLSVDQVRMAATRLFSFFFCRGVYRLRVWWECTAKSEPLQKQIVCFCSSAAYAAAPVCAPPYTSPSVAYVLPYHTMSKRNETAYIYTTYVWNI